MRDYLELRARDARRKQIPVRGRHQLVGVAVNRQSGSGNLREAAVGFPNQNTLQLSEVCVGGWKPFTADHHVFFDPLSRRVYIVDVRPDGLRRLLWILVTSHQYLEDFGLRSHGVGATGSCAA